MKKRKNFIITTGCIIAIMMTSSCSVEKLADSFKCDSGNLLSKANVEKTFYHEALDAYTADQSTANCQELKNSGGDYKNAVNLYLDCNEAGDEAVKRELKEAEKVLADLECS